MTTHYEVCSLDANGTVTATDTFSMLSVAIKFAQRIVAPATPAVIVERHRTAHMDGGEIVWDTETVWYTGDENALLAWHG